ncbi:hypothetical protein RPD76_17110 [Methylomonas sp. MV1]|nr:hypothetical protein [Methylomonas sp. MV1]MDT4331639.1 hypothetical protein [Methylomonas sp. MV1]
MSLKIGFIPYQAFPIAPQPYPAFALFILTADLRSIFGKAFENPIFVKLSRVA